MKGSFENRSEAGRYLAGKLNAYRGRHDAIILGLPRGGIPVACEVARYLGLPMDFFLVRKLGVPGYEELAMGAIATGNVTVLNDDVIRSLPAPEETVKATIARETGELERREALYRQGRSAPDLRDRVVILVDDGLATGATMRAAATALRKQGAARIVAAVPVGAPETCRELEKHVDEMFCAIEPPLFTGVGQFYENFSQTTDEEVRRLLESASQFGASRRPTEFAGQAGPQTHLESP